MTKTKNLFQTAALLLSLLVTIGILMPLTASALDHTIDPDQKGSLSIYKYLGDDKDPDKLIKDDSVEYTIYKVGTLVQNQTGTGNVTINYEDAQGAPIDVSALNPDTYDTTGLSGISKTPNSTTGQMLFENLDLGLYLVKETKVPQSVVKSNNFFVQIPMSTNEGWEYDVEAEPKNTLYDGGLTKTVNGGSETSVSRGDEISYKIEATVPTIIDSLEKFNIVDIADNYITIDKDLIQVTSDQQTLTKGIDFNITEIDNGDGTTTRKIVFTETGIGKLQTGETITVTYTGTVTGDAPSNTALKNRAYIEFDENTIPPVIPEVYVYDYAFLKVGSDNTSAGLQGAEFTLKSGNDYMVLESDKTWSKTTNAAQATKFVSDENGIVKFEGLKAGTYTVTEIKAPNGYTLLAQPFTIEVSKASSIAVENGSYSITVVNQKDGTKLPETGGNGIYLFLIIGGVFVLAAGGLYLYSIKKRT